MSPIRLAELLIPLQHTTRALSVGWREARNKLQDMDLGGLDEANRTIVHVLDIIREAREQTKTELQGLDDRIASLKRNPECVTEPFFLETVAQRICRTTGVDAPTDLEQLEVDLNDHHSEIGEMAEQILEARDDTELDSSKAEGWGIYIAEALENLVSTRDFAGQRDLLEAEFQLLVQQVEELTR
ncbi:hypothetical protein ACHAPT_007449 [Fusarium lateritium]